MPISRRAIRFGWWRWRWWCVCVGWGDKQLHLNHIKTYTAQHTPKAKPHGAKHGHATRAKLTGGSLYGRAGSLFSNPHHGCTTRVWLRQDIGSSIHATRRLRKPHKAASSDTRGGGSQRGKWLFSYDARGQSAAHTPSLPAPAVLPPKFERRLRTPRLECARIGASARKSSFSSFQVDHRWRVSE